MHSFVHAGDPLTSGEWNALNRVVTAVGNATIARKFIDVTGPLGAGAQTLPTQTLVGITEGYKRSIEPEHAALRPHTVRGQVVPIIFKDFVLHWRDVAEARSTKQPLSMAKAAAAASMCARGEDHLALYGCEAVGSTGLMTVEGRNSVSGLSWDEPGRSFDNFKAMTERLVASGLRGPFAAVVHPRVYEGMHRVLAPSSLLEIAHVRDLLTAGVFQSPLLRPNAGLVVSTGRQHLELVISVDTSAAFLGARRMNLPFRVFKAVTLNILRADAICSFE